MASWLEETDASNEGFVSALSLSAVLAFEPAVSYAPSIGHLHTRPQFSSHNAVVTELTVPIITKPARLSIRVDDEVAEKLKGDRDMLIAIGKASMRVAELLMGKHVGFDAEVSLFRDPESRDYEIYMVRFKLRGLSYDEVLDLWDEASRRAHSDLPPETSEKVCIVLDLEE